MSKESSAQLKITEFKQSEGYCGPASLKMILAYYSIEKTEDELADIIGATREYGFDPQDIVEAAIKMGFEAEYRVRSDLQDLFQLISIGIPVIIQWFSPEEGGHYSILSGFDDQQISIVDPFLGETRNMPIDYFINRWFELDDYPPKEPANFKLRESIIIKPK